MKLVESNNDTVTVQLSRQELRDIHSALCDARLALEKEPVQLKDLLSQCEGNDDPEEIEALIYEAGRAEEDVEGLQNALKWAERLLPRVYDLLDGFRPLAWPSEVTPTEQ